MPDIPPPIVLETRILEAEDCEGSWDFRLENEDVVETA